jgi:ABC-type branched-subunit amino acid transport system substrate-binding protein
VICDIIRLTRKSLFLGLVLAIVISDSFIYFAQIQTKAFYSSWIIGINASTAAALAIFVVYRHMQQRRHHPQDHHDKSHVALAIGLSLWLCADLIWATYEIALEIVPPVPSAADFLWLSAYGFLAYYLYSTYTEFHNRFNFNKRILVASIIGCGIFLTYIIALTTSLSVLSSPKGIAMFAVIIAYPIMDAILMVPALVILVNFRKEPLWFTPWICESLGIFLIAISDSWFAVVVLTSILEQFWLSAVFFAAHYLVIAAGLLWYVKFLLTHSQPSDERRRSEQMETSIIAPRGGFTDKYKSEEEKNHKRISYIGLTVIAAIVVIAVAIGVYFSLYSLPSFSSFFPFSNAGSEEILPAPATALKQQTVTIGALIPVTGVSSSLGESEGAALKIATKDINEYLFKTHSGIGIKLVIEDTQSNPSVSLEKLKQLAAKGIKIVIGPATSAAVQGVKDYADKNGIILISPSSTAPSLAIAGDNLFRFVPDDRHQGETIAKRMWDDGIRVVVPFWRTDVYGNDLVRATKQSLQELGGRTADGVGYIPNTGDFAASLNRINFIVWDQDLKALDSKVNHAISQYGVDKVGVYFVAFDEIAPIFIQAQNHPTLSKVKWYGSDGSTLNNKLVRNTDAAAFALKTNFITPIFGVEDDNDERFKHVEAQIHEQIERTPRSYASVAYDILWVAALAENNTKATHDINYLKNTIVKIADSYNGITGNTTLNEFGDRKYGDYDFWAIGNGESTHDSFIWKRVGKYVPNIRTEQGAYQLDLHSNMG